MREFEVIKRKLDMNITIEECMKILPKEAGWKILKTLLRLLRLPKEAEEV